jgi:hypothetical protein
VSSNGEDGFTYGYLDGVRANGDLAPAWYHAYWRREGDNWRIAALGDAVAPDGATTAAIAPRKNREARVREDRRKTPSATAKEAADCRSRILLMRARRVVADAFATFRDSGRREVGEGVRLRLRSR